MNQHEVDRICRERMQPIMDRMEALAAENARLREDAGVEIGKAVERRMQAVKASQDNSVVERAVWERNQAQERAAKAEKKWEYYKGRAYRAERKLRMILEGELDPFDLMTHEQAERASESALPTAD